MTIIHFFYKFETESFQKVISPVVEAADNGDLRKLYILAESIITSRPELWDLLDQLNLGPPLDLFNEYISGRELLMIVLSNHLEKISEYNKFWSHLEYSFHSLGWTKTETKDLVFGTSLCDLVHSNKSSGPIQYKQCGKDIMSVELPWCTGYGGWVSYEQVGEFWNKLNRIKDSEITGKVIEDDSGNQLNLKEEVIRESICYVRQAYEVAFHSKTNLLMVVA